MKKRKIVKRSILIIIFIAVASLFYIMGYLPILGNLIAQKKLSKYLINKEDTVQKVSTKYNWYNAEYVSMDKTKLKYRLYQNIIIDEKVLEEEGLKANAKYNTIINEFPKNLNLPSHSTVFTGLNGSDYSTKSQMMYLLGVYNTEEISEEESMKMPADIATKVIELMGEDYNITSMQIIYYDKNGGYESSVSFGGFKKLEYDEMLSKTEKVDRLPEDYLEWLSKQ